MSGQLSSVTILKQSVEQSTINTVLTRKMKPNNIFSLLPPIPISKDQRIAGFSSPFLQIATVIGSTTRPTIVRRLPAESVDFVLDCKTVRISAYSSTSEQSNKRSGKRLKRESETGEGRFFFLSPHTPYGREARLLRARKTLTSHFTVLFTDFEKKNRLFCSLTLFQFL